MNQGLYNGFLVAGLVWGLWLGDAGFAIKSFFLGCVIVAGIFGALTVSRKILFVQAVPALLALPALSAAILDQRSVNFSSIRRLRARTSGVSPGSSG